MDLSTLSDSELTSALVNLAGEERATILQMLYHLIELEKRRLFRDEGYSSLFDYCTRKLCYSEAGAWRRITGARCLRENPELAELFLEGKVTLCSIATAAKGIKEQITTVEEIIGKSQREVQRLVALKEPVSKRPSERVRPVAVAKSELPLFGQATAEQPEQEERYELKFSVSKEVYQQFEEAKAQLSNALGSEVTIERVFSKLLERIIKPSTRQAPKRIKERSESSRYIPRAVKREVFRRDGGQCTFRAPDGTRCCEKHYLHIDHIEPFSCGGKSEPGNLRLLCSVHNRLLAERYFGREKIQSYFQR